MRPRLAQEALVRRLQLHREQVRRRLGVEPHRTVAVGDQRNDLEMLHWAAVGYAMGQAPEEVLRIADRTTGAVEEDGLADALAEVLDELA